MSYKLIRNCSHGSKIATYLVSKNHASYYLKVSTEVDGIDDLKREHSGWQWYLKKKYIDYRDICSIDIRSDSYARLVVKVFEGETAKTSKGLSGNFSNIKRIVDHYCSIWGMFDSHGPMHGDLSLDNILVTESDVIFIDWEHFRSSSAPWGFDILYLLFETLWFSFHNPKVNNDYEMGFLLKLLDYLNNQGSLPVQFRVSPLMSLINFIKENIHLWGKQVIEFPMKLPILEFTSDDILYVENYLKLNSVLIGDKY